MIWLNGRLTPPSEARIDPADRGFTLGDGLFETIRADAGRLCHLARHLARLRAGAAVLGLAVPYDDPTLGAAMAAVLAGAGLADGALRLTLTRGPGARGLAVPARPVPTVLITAGPLPAAGPVRAVIAQGTRRNAFSPLAALKSLNALDSILAREEAVRCGADDALLVNTEGRLAEASAANLFLLIDGRLLTPPVSDGALAGIRRGLILETAGAAGLVAAECSLTPADIARAEAGVLTTSLAVRALLGVGGRSFEPARVERLAATLSAIPPLSSAG